MDSNTQQAQPEQEKLCINCKHYRMDGSQALCFSPRRRRSPVDGKFDRTWCSWARTLRDARSCGPNGLWYEQKEGGLDSQSDV